MRALLGRRRRTLVHKGCRVARNPLDCAPSPQDAAETGWQATQSGRLLVEAKWTTPVWHGLECQPLSIA